MTQFTQTRHATNPATVGAAVQDWLDTSFEAASDRESVLADEADIVLEAVLRYHGVLHPADVEVYFEIGSDEHAIVHLNVDGLWLEVNVDGDVATF